MHSCTTIIILHWLFHKSLRRLTLATHHFILTDSPRDLSTVSYLGRQAFPNSGHYLIDSFKDAVADNNTYGYILISVQPGRRKELAVCTNIFSDKIIVYQQDPQSKSFKKMLLVDPSMVKDGILENKPKTCNNNVTINGFPSLNGSLNTPQTNSAMPVLQLPQGGHSTDVSIHNTTPQMDQPNNTSSTTTTTNNTPGAGDESRMANVKDAVAQTSEGVLHPVEGSFSPLFLKGIFKKSTQSDHVCSTATSSSTQTDASSSAQPPPPPPPPTPPPMSNTSSQTDHATTLMLSKGSQTKKRPKKKHVKSPPSLPSLPPSPPPQSPHSPHTAPPSLPPSPPTDPPQPPQPPQSSQPVSSRPPHKIVKKQNNGRGGIQVKPKHKLLKSDRKQSSQSLQDPATNKKPQAKSFVSNSNITFKTVPKKTLKPAYGKRKNEDLVDQHKIAEKYRKTSRGAQPYSATGTRKFYPFKNWYA